MGFYENFLAEIHHAAYVKFKNPSRLAAYLGVPPNLITRWLKKEKIPGMDTAGDVLEKLGVETFFSRQGEHRPTDSGSKDHGIFSQVREMEARLLADKDEIIALLKKHISMLEGSEGNAFKIEIFQYIGLLAEAAAREGRTLADIVAFHWSDLPRLALEERDVLWLITRSILSKHPEFARARPHAVERAQLPPVPNNKKQLIFASLDIVQKMIYDLRDTADTLEEPDTA